MVACARFDLAPAHGAAILEVETDKGETVRQELSFPATTPSPLPRTACLRWLAWRLPPA